MVACRIYNNYMTSKQTSGGGGVWVNGSGATLRNCLLYGNDALYAAGGYGDGGGVYLTAGTVESCTIVRTYVAR